MDLTNPLSIWCQLSSLCFFCAGIYGDLLLIRLFCFLAYFLLLLNVTLGSPLWPDFKGIVGHLGLDTFLWSTVCLYVHGSSLLSLLMDEKPVELTEDEEALWRLLYRTAGLSKRLFQELFIANKDLNVLELESGKLINTDDYFYIIHQGQVQLQWLDPITGIPTTGRILVSAEMFDLKYLGLISADSIFSVGALKCTSLSPVRLFQIPKNHLRQMAQHNLAKTAFQALLINNLSFAAESLTNETRRSRMAEQYCDRVFRPLEEWEQPPRFAAGSGRALENPLRHLWHALLTSISPPWGHNTGIRQTQLVPPQRRQQQEQEEPQAVPLFHRLSNSFRIRKNNNSNNNRSVGENSGSSTGMLTLYETSSRSDHHVPAMVQLDGYESTASA